MEVSLESVGPLTLRRLTIEEYHRLGEAGVLGDDDRVELFDGLLIHRAPIGPEHQFIVDRLIESLAEQRAGRFELSVGRPLPIAGLSEPQPDVVLCRSGSRRRHVHVRPTDVLLIIEVSDASLVADLGKKRALYETAQIPEYWVVDVPGRCVRAFRIGSDGRYAEEIIRAGVLSLRDLPGITVRVEDLF